MIKPGFLIIIIIIIIKETCPINRIDGVRFEEKFHFEECLIWN